MALSSASCSIPSMTSSCGPQRSAREDLRATELVAIASRISRSASAALGIAGGLAILFHGLRSLYCDSARFQKSLLVVHREPSPTISLVGTRGCAPSREG